MDRSFRTIDIGTGRRTAGTNEQAMRAVYVYFMKAEPERVRSVAPRHAAYWHTGRLSEYLGGPFADRSGGLITFECGSPQEAAELVAGDPFVLEGLVERSWLKEWRPE